MFTPTQVLALVKAGFSKAEIEALAGGSTAEAPRRAAATPKPNTFHAQVIVAKAPDRAARKNLAAAMREAGVEPTGEAWVEAKAALGLR